MERSSRSGVSAAAKTPCGNTAARFWMTVEVVIPAPRVLGIFQPIPVVAASQAWGEGACADTPGPPLTVARLLFREKLAEVAERFEFQRIAGGIVKEHRRLFAWQALKTEVGFDRKLHARLADALGQRVKLIPLQHHAEMRHGHIVT